VCERRARTTARARILAVLLIGDLSVGDRGGLQA
jgi:hypothetical protein